MSLDPFEGDLLHGELAVDRGDLFQQIPVRTKGRIWVNRIIGHPVIERFDHTLIIRDCANDQRVISPSGNAEELTA